MIEIYIAFAVTLLVFFRLFELGAFKRLLRAVLHRIFFPGIVTKWIEAQEKSLAKERERVRLLYEPKRKKSDAI